MWRRVASLSPLISSSKSTLFNQAPAPHGLISKSLATETPTLVKDTISFQGKTPIITFVLGGPCSGKGTQCVKIAEKFGFTHLGARDLLGKEFQANSKYCTIMLNTLREGKVLAPEVTVEVIQNAMESSGNYKFLIDGFPQNEESRIAFDRIIGVEPNNVLLLDCTEEEMVKRVLKRNEDQEGLVVDNDVDTIKKRIKVFEILIQPIVDYYSKKGKLHKINAVGTEDEVFEQVFPVFAACEDVQLEASSI